VRHPNHLRPGRHIARPDGRRLHRPRLRKPNRSHPWRLRKLRQWQQNPVDQILNRIPVQKLSDAQKDSVERIRRFANLSHEALEKGDMQQAGALADRALLLAQGLVRAP
jgi:hypothetical protein